MSAELMENADDARRRSRKADFLRRKLPYAAVLTLAVVGVAYTNISHQPLAGYWEFLAIATGVLCVVTEWKNADDRQARFRLMWKQALHWAAILVTMNIVLLSGVRNLLPAPATSLVLLTLLALGTFLAGVEFFVPANLLSWPCNGPRRAGDSVAQTVHIVFGLGRNVLDRYRYGVLAARSRRKLAT